MPAAVAWIGGVVAGGGIGAAIATTAINLLTSTAISYGLAQLNRPRQPRPRDLQTQIRSGSAERHQHFGRARVSGALMYADWANLRDFTPPPGGFWGPVIDWMTRRAAFVLLAISTGGITGVDRWYLDGKPVDVDADGWVQTKPWKDIVRLRVRTGIGDQFSGGDWEILRAAFPMRWTSGHRLDGVATILGQFMSVAPEDVADVYPGGRPPEISAVIRGAPCWEPATGNASFTNNPMRHLLHYLSSAGMGAIPPSEFDLASWDVARIDCNDELPTVGGTRQRYIGGGSAALAEPQKDVAARILQSVAGSLYLTQAGLIGVRVGKYRAPSAIVDDSKIVSIDYGPGKPALDRVTTLVPEYVEPALDYTETTADPWEDARAIARYGEPKPNELPLVWTQHHGQAGALAKIEAARRNPALTASVALRFWGLRLLGEERVFLHRPARGINMVPMRIVGLSLDLDAGDGVVKVELESEGPEVLNWTRAEEGTRPAAPNRVRNARPEIVAPVITNVSVSAAVISATISPATGYFLEAQFRPTGGSWAKIEVNQETGYFRTPPLPDGSTFEVRARWRLSGLAALLADSSDRTRVGDWTTVTGIQVIANGNAPAQPVLVSATRTGDVIDIVFEPDLGANYALTVLRRGASFEGGEHVRTFRDQASTISYRITNAPAPVRYWLRSGNGSGVNAAPLDIGIL